MVAMVGYCSEVNVVVLVTVFVRVYLKKKLL